MLVSKIHCPWARTVRNSNYNRQLQALLGVASVLKRKGRLGGVSWQLGNEMEALQTFPLQK